MKYDSLDRASAKEIRQILNDVLTPVLKEHNLELAQGNLQYCEDWIKFSGFTIKVIGSKTEEMRALEDYNSYTNVKLDTEKVVNIFERGECKLVGFLTRAPKYPFIVEWVATGKQSKISLLNAERYFGIHE